MQYNGKQIHSGMDEPSGRYAKTIVFASTSSFFQWWKIIRARNINAAEQGSYLAGDDFISGQWYFCPATVRADNNSGLPQKHSFCGKREQSPDKRCFCRQAKRAQRRIVNAVAGNGGSSAGKAERWNSYGVFLQNTVWNCFKTKKISCTRLSGRVRLNFDIRN